VRAWLATEQLQPEQMEQPHWATEVRQESDPDCWQVAPQVLLLYCRARWMGPRQCQSEPVGVQVWWTL
jgi:hypothetical protein